VLETVESFWKLVSKDSFPKMKHFALKMHSVLRNAHVRESGLHTFSMIKQVKFENRNRMKDETLDDSLRLATTTHWY